jgi:hypothetical protein
MQKNKDTTSLKFLRLDPFYEMDIKAIDLSYYGKEGVPDSKQVDSFYDIQDYVFTYSFVVKMGDQVVGYCYLTITPNQHGFQRCMVIDQIKVEKSLCKNGIGTKMLAQIKRIARNVEADGVIFHIAETSALANHLIKKWNLESMNAIYFKLPT